MKLLYLSLLLLLLPLPVICGEIRGIVVNVTDGDTLQVRSGEQIHKIRLVGIDAPELRQAFGRDARQALAELTAGNLVVVIWSKRDRYGRLVGTVLLGSLDVNLYLIRNDSAWYFRRYAKDVPEIEQLQYEAAEAEAREGKRGLWQFPHPMAPWKFRRAARKK